MKSTPTLNLVKLLLADNLCHSFGELLDKTGITAPYLSKILTSLHGDHVVQSERVGTTTYYCLTPTS